MIWNDHKRLEGTHAYLSASSYHWLNYDEAKMRTTYTNHLKVQRGTELHDLAQRCIKLGVKLPRTKKTINMHVNDAISMNLDPEVLLYYSKNCYGTADAIGFDGRTLHIHDLKTGDTLAHMDQLHIYAAIFCLEYAIPPEDISFELRIYQSDECRVDVPESRKIREVMDKIIWLDSIIEDMRLNGNIAE